MKHEWIWFIVPLMLSLPAAPAAMDIQSSSNQADAETKVVPEDEALCARRAALQSIRLRGTFSSEDMLGSVTSEEFREYDVAATFRLPWESYSVSGWGVGMGLMASVGAIYGSNDTGIVISLLPLVVFGSRDGRFSLDLGAGAAVLSNSQFGEQDFGAPLQFALTAGGGIPIYKRFGLGYRFLHYSDAGLHGSHTTGADLHMIEWIFRF